MRNDFSDLGTAVASLPDMQGRKICIVSDSKVASLYLDTISNMLSAYFDTVTSFVFPEGEENKTLQTVQDLYQHLILKGFERRDILAALGGGVTGDLTGFTAATYLRGIRFIQIPTSLLAQVDSSIGGKTGVDFRGFKNMVGAFHHPVLVYSCSAVFESLHPWDYCSGMGEIIKHGLIRDAEYYKWLKENSSILQHATSYKPGNTELHTEMVLRSDKIKQAIVENDPEEKGERAILNFGHTIGHAIEKYAYESLSHGMCVSVGMKAAAWISKERGMLSQEEYDDICHTLYHLYKLPVSACFVNTVMGISAEEILQTTKSDKKMEKGHVKMILLDRIGHAVICHDVSDKEILAAIKEILE
ncbi:MAG: 3-dehydroquinate synthase [Solobacterium sp.]|nr:3-dehydroquinate synthase [Solobacterium sp.]